MGVTTRLDVTEKITLDVLKYNLPKVFDFLTALYPAKDLANIKKYNAVINAIKIIATNDIILYYW